MGYSIPIVISDMINFEPKLTLTVFAQQWTNIVLIYHSIYTYSRLTLADHLYTYMELRDQKYSSYTTPDIALLQLPAKKSTLRWGSSRNPEPAC